MAITPPGRQESLQGVAQEPGESVKTDDNQDERTAQYIEKSLIFNDLRASLA
ncbi:MAG: hypothetical protein IIC11_03670 [Proteobacteria bacterium]|nr:hypothetical protein [Pseudomonadota bacterium]